MSLKRISLIGLAVAVIAIGGVALATAPTFTVTLLARGDLNRVDAHHNGIEVEGHGSTDVAMATVTWEPGQSSGWHHHPGVVLAVVKSGTLTMYNVHCHKEVVTAGEGFVEASNRSHLVRNNGNVTAVVEATFIVKSPTVDLRIDDPQPKGCSAH